MPPPPKKNNFFPHLPSFCQGANLVEKKKQLMEMIAKKKAELEAKAAAAQRRAEQPLFLVWLAPGWLWHMFDIGVACFRNIVATMWGYSMKHISTRIKTG